MSEPVTLFRGNEQVTTVAPSEVHRLIAEGWTHEQGQQTGEAQGKHGEETQGRQEIEGRPEVTVEKRTIYVGELVDVDKLLPPVEPDPQFTPKKRTRK